MREQRLLLDTCALLWLASGDVRLSPVARNAIDRASLVLVCAISAWEIALKASRGQLLLPLPAIEWFNGTLKQHHLVLTSLDVPVLVGANDLPWHHRDPADRFIIATALRENAVIVTSDPKFMRYGAKVLDCSVQE